MKYRYIAMSIPGDEDRGDETLWYVYDKKTGRGQRVPSCREADMRVDLLNEAEALRLAIH